MYIWPPFSLTFEKMLFLRSEIHVYFNVLSDPVYKQDSYDDISFLSIQMIATLSSSQLLLKLCLIYKHLLLFLLYIKEYWWKGLSYSCWHKSDLGYRFFSHNKQTKENPRAAQSAKAHTETYICVWTLLIGNVPYVVQAFYCYFN